MTMRWLAGTYADSISILDLDTASGRLTQVAECPCAARPSFLTLHPRLPVVYAVHELRSWNGNFGGGVGAYAIGADDTLSLIGAQPTHGEDPCHLAVDPSGRWLVVANYTSGHVTSLPVDPNGALGPAAEVLTHHGSSIDPKRQTSPHPHHVAIRGGELLISDLGTDEVIPYRLDAAGQFQSAGPPVKTLPGGGPRRIVFHPNLPCGYVLDELQASLTRFTAEAGAPLLACETVPMLPADYAERRSGAELQIAPSGRFAYASNRGHDSIACFAIDPDNGALTPIGHTPSGGAEPRHFAISPCGNYLLAANQRSDSVVLFRLDQETGVLTETGQSVPVPKPVCLLPLPEPLP
jgi:6-phosphogluconolactonase